MRRPVRRTTRRTAHTTLLLAVLTTAGLTGCQSDGGGDDAAAKPASSAPASTSASASASAAASAAATATTTATATASTPAEPFAGLTGAEIVERARVATTGAKSLRLTGTVPDDEGGGTLRVDFALDRRGRCAGTLGQAGQGEVELVRTGDTVYMKYDERFLRAQGEGEPKADTDAVVALMAGQWVSMAATGQDAEDMAAFCDLDEVLGDTEETGGTVTRDGTTTVDGRPALILRAKDGTDVTTLYVATEGKPYLLRSEGEDGKDPVSLTLGGFDEPVPAKVPAGKIVDLDALTG